MGVQGVQACASFDLRNYEGTTVDRLGRKSQERLLASRDHSGELPLDQNIGYDFCSFDTGQFRVEALEFDAECIVTDA